MREDMFKVIVERPRRGARFKMKRSSQHDIENLPSRVGMKRYRAVKGTQSKWLNENLAPLERYLMKQVGRPWRKVYSEICEHLDASHTVKQHVRDHLRDFVVMKVAIGRDGEWMNGNSYPCPRRGDEKAWYQPLYVDPRDGLLKRSDKYWKKNGIDPRPYWRRKKEPLQDYGRQVIDQDTELRCIRGIWYRIRFRQDKHVREADTVHDKLTGKPVWPGLRHAYCKEQLSSAALKEHGLENVVLDSRATGTQRFLPASCKR